MDGHPLPALIHSKTTLWVGGEKSWLASSAGWRKRRSSSWNWYAEDRRRYTNERLSPAQSFSHFTINLFFLLVDSTYSLGSCHTWGVCAMAAAPSAAIPADTRRWITVGLALVQRRRRWTNVKPAVIQRLVSAGILSPNDGSMLVQWLSLRV